MKSLSTVSSNQLQSASSPYLRQHAHNPVDWYPWGGKAFAKAQADMVEQMAKESEAVAEEVGVVAEEAPRASSVVE